MIAKGWEEEVLGGRPGSIGPSIRVDKVMVVLADIPINRRGPPIWVVIVTHGDDEVGIPAFHKAGYV